MTLPAVGDLATAAQADLLIGPIGARARTNAVQALTANVAASLNNGGTNAWTAVEDSGGFVSASGGTTTPISVPAGMAGLYIVGVGYTQSAIATTRGEISIFVNAAQANSNSRGVFTTDQICSYTICIRLAVSDTVGAQALTNIGANASIGCDVYAYRIAN